MKIFFQYWVPVVLYMFGIFYLSSLSSPEEHLPSFDLPLNDKILHGIEYTILGILCFRAFKNGGSALSPQRAFWLTIITTALFAVTDEFHQSFVPMRQADPLDLVADILGSTVGALGGLRIYHQPEPSMYFFETWRKFFL